MSKEKSLCSKRVEWIDVAKAIGVFCVVAGHTGLPILLKCWIYVFHMPMFFSYRVCGLGIENLESTL